MPRDAGLPSGASGARASNRTRAVNIAADLLRWEDDGDRTLLIEPGGARHSYADVAAASRKVAAMLLRAGVARGDRVVLLIPNGVAYLAAYYGTLLTRAIAVPLALGSTADHCAVINASCTPTLGLAADDHAAALLSRGGIPAHVLDRSALAHELATFDDTRLGPGSDAAQIIFTSGTTGSPKGVTLSHAAIASNTSGIVRYLGLRSSDRVGVVLDFAYSYGNSLLQTHVRVGASLALLGPMTFPKQVVQRLAATECTGFSGVPSTFGLLIRYGTLADLRVPSLRYVTCAGGALPPEHVRQLREALRNVEIFLMYGQTEASARLSYLPPAEIDRRPASIGRGIPGVQLEVLRPDGSPAAPGEEGEIVAAGPSLMTGYWGDPDATRQALREGKLWTGDLAVRDEEGYITITGRRSDLIKTAAYRVHPKEVEECIVGLADVHECAVVGVPDELLGEALVACFCSADVPALGDIRSRLRDRLPEYKWPRHVVRVDEFPRTASGKIKRRELSLAAAAALERGAAHSP